MSASFDPILKECNLTCPISHKPLLCLAAGSHDAMFCPVGREASGRLQYDACQHVSSVAVGNLLEWLSCDVLNPFLIFLWKSMQMKQDAMLGGCEKIGFLSDLVLDC